MRDRASRGICTQVRQLRDTRATREVTYWGTSTETASGNIFYCRAKAIRGNIFIRALTRTGRRRDGHDRFARGRDVNRT